MKVTLRKLARHKDWSAAHGRRPRHNPNRLGDDHDHHEEEFAAQPVDVTTQDLVTELAQVRGMLDRREISATDLINDGTGWMTLAEHPALDVTEAEIARAGSLLKFAFEAGEGRTVVLWALAALFALASFAFVHFRHN
jgi:hypothetical protein